MVAQFGDRHAGVERQRVTDDDRDRDSPSREHDESLRVNVFVRDQGYEMLGTQGRIEFATRLIVRAQYRERAVSRTGR